MPSSSQRQARFMAAAAHDSAFAKRAGISQSVAREFNQADKGTPMLSRAVRTANRYAGGGFTGSLVRPQLKSAKTGGLLKSAVPGRTDKIPMKVKTGSYVLPADVVSGLGENNTLAGAQTLDKMFGLSPGSGKLKQPNVQYGKMGAIPRAPGQSRASGQSSVRALPGTNQTSRSVRQRFEAGGEPQGGDEIPIIVAGGEYLLDPEHVEAIGTGDRERGFEILDAFVKHVRKKNTDKLSGLPGPKKGGSKFAGGRCVAPRRYQGGGATIPMAPLMTQVALPSFPTSIQQQMPVPMLPTPQAPDFITPPKAPEVSQQTGSGILGQAVQSLPGPVSATSPMTTPLSEKHVPAQLNPQFLDIPTPAAAPEKPEPLPPAITKKPSWNPWDIMRALNGEQPYPFNYSKGMDLNDLDWNTFGRITDTSPAGAGIMGANGQINPYSFQWDSNTGPWGDPGIFEQINRNSLGQRFGGSGDPWGGITPEHMGAIDDAVTMLNARRDMEFNAMVRAAISNPGAFQGVFNKRGGRIGRYQGGGAAVPMAPQIPMAPLMAAPPQQGQLGALPPPAQLGSMAPATPIQPQSFSMTPPTLQLPSVPAVQQPGEPPAAPGLFGGILGGGLPVATPLPSPVPEMPAQAVTQTPNPEKHIPDQLNTQFLATPEQPPLPPKQEFPPPPAPEIISLGRREYWNLINGRPQYEGMSNPELIPQLRATGQFPFAGAGTLDVTRGLLNGQPIARELIGTGHWKPYPWPTGPNAFNRRGGRIRG